LQLFAVTFLSSFQVTASAKSKKLIWPREKVPLATL